ncbi:MAG: hypothetical protein AB7N80_01975 [Bdellovibrionales bacterium]
MQKKAPQKRKGQLPLLQQKYPLQYGGVLRTKAKNRGFRPLSSKESMHVVLRSSLAKKEWSFQHKRNRKRLAEFINRFSAKKGIELIKVANVGNHFHFHVRIPNRTLYKAWIRGLSSAIAVMVAGHEGLRRIKAQAKAKLTSPKTKVSRFWDYRPFSRVVRGLRAYLSLKDYVEINELEGLGELREVAVVLVKNEKMRTLNST